MKTWPLIISILVILAVLGSPVLAISKSDLISSYQGQSIQTPIQSPASLLEAHKAFRNIWPPFFPVTPAEDDPVCGNCDNRTSFQKAKPYIDPTHIPTPTPIPSPENGTPSSYIPGSIKESAETYNPPPSFGEAKDLLLQIYIDQIIPCDRSDPAYPFCLPLKCCGTIKGQIK
jgi:hypothetical protein